MKQVKRKITFNGLDINLDIDINKLVSEVKGKYKTEVDTLRSSVSSRNRYILKMHSELKNKQNFMYVFTMCCKIHDKVKDIYGINYTDYMILAFICDKDHVHYDKIKRYLDSIGVTINRRKISKMIKLDYIKNSPKNGYVYITDIGKGIISGVTDAMKQDYAYYNKNKPYIKKSSSSVFYTDKPKYSDEEIEKRRNRYRVMMQPFWDAGYSVMPKDVSSRYRILKDWLSQEPEKRNNEMYDKCLKKWESNLHGV